MSFPIITEQRFFKTSLNQLFDVASPVVLEYVEKYPSIKAIADAIIINIAYPFHMGQPDDTHVWNAFHGNQKWCKRIDADFWQKASETVAVKVGDCEDSSIAFVTCALAKGLAFENVYEAFGIVRDASTKQILGGHGWSYSKMIPDENFRCYESTLDTPPAEYPVVEDIKVPFKLGDIEYVPEWLFNVKTFEVVGSMSYKDRKKEEKETHAKYHAIAEAWKQETKPHKAMHKSKVRKLRRLLRQEP